MFVTGLACLASYGVMKDTKLSPNPTDEELTTMDALTISGTIFTIVGFILAMYFFKKSIKYTGK